MWLWLCQKSLGTKNKVTPKNQENAAPAPALCSLAVLNTFISDLQVLNPNIGKYWNDASCYLTNDTELR